MSPPLRFTDLGVHFTCTVDDLSGTWSKIRPYLEARLPLRHAQFRNSLGVSSTLDELHLRYVNTGDAYVQRLRQLSYSPVTWFRNPFCQLVLFSCEDVEEYKRLHRPQIRAIADPEARTAVAPELVIAYVAPAAADSRATAKVYDTMRRDFAYKRRDRCVRLDPPPSTAPGPVMGTPRGSIAGLEILEYLVREAVMLTFEARTGAYQEEIRRHMSNRLEVGWTFTPLFLIKDSLAVMLEAAGMYEDALREYAELDVCHADTAAQAQAWQQQAATPLPPDPEGPSAAPPDEVGPMWMPWPGIRRTALALPQVPDFVMRQFLFASQARILLKLRRWTELAERGKGFIEAGRRLLERDVAAPASSTLPATWAFAAYATLASAVLHAAREGGAPRPSSPEARRRRGPALAAEPRGAAPARLGGPRAGAPVEPGEEAVAVTSAASDVDWDLGPLPDERAGWRLQAGGPGQSQPPRRASGDAPAAPALHVALGSVFAAARAELDRLAAGRRAVDGDRAGVGEGPTRLLDSVDGSDPLRDWEGVSARFAALPAEGGRPPTPRRLHPAPDTASQDGEESLDAVDLDARAPSARSVTPRAQGEGGEGATASEGHGEAGEIAPAPRAVTEAGSHDPGSLVALVAHSRHISTTSLESASASGDDRQAGDAGVGVAPAHFRRRSAVDTSAAETAVSRPGSHTRSHGPGTPPLPGPGQGITARTHSAPPTAAPTVSDYLDPRFVEQQVFSSLGPIPPAPAPPAPASPGPGAASLPRHWRLRAALADPRAFLGLWLGLSMWAAACFSLAGRERTARLLRADAAARLLGAGARRAAADLLDAAARAAARDGWPAVLLPLLRLLLDALEGGAGGPEWDGKEGKEGKGGVPPGGSPRSDDSSGEASAAAGTRSLLAAAALLGLEAGAGSADQPAQDGTAAARAARRLLAAADRCGGGGGWAAAAETRLDGAFALSARLAPGCGARFFGRDPPSAGAPGAAVGDGVRVEVVLRNRLPLALPLAGLGLTLALLEEVPEPSVSGAAPGGLQAPATPSGPAASPLGAGHSNAAPVPPTPRPLSPTSPTLGTDGRGPPAPFAVVGEGPARDDAVDLRGVSAQGRPVTWRETCLLESGPPVIVVGDPGTQEDGGESFEAVPASGTDNLPSPGTRDRPPPTPLAPLPPGETRLRFTVSPLRPGVLVPRTLRALLAGQTLEVPVAGPATRAAPVHPRDARQRPAVALVSVPRPHAAAAPAPGCATLVAGQAQWLGLHVGLADRAARGARVDVRWGDGVRPRGADGAAPPAGAGSAAVRRAAASLPAGFAAAPLAAGAADPDPAASLRLPSASLVPPTEPRLRPLCRGAIGVHAGAGERGGGAAATVPEVDLAGTEAGDPQAPAPHACLQLPDGFLRAAQTDGAASLWWWVRADAPVSAPAAVRVLPAGHGAAPAPNQGAPGRGPPGAAGAAPLALDLGLEWEAEDCARSAVASCALRVAPPFEVEWSAREVPGRREEGGRLLLGAALRCAAGNAVEVTGLALSPQPGARLEEGCEEEAGDLATGDREAQGDRAGVRARLEHGQTLHCSWLLRLDPGEGGRAGLAARLRQAARARPCELAVAYEVRAAPPAAAAARGWDEAVRALLPGGDGEACLALDAGDGEVQACTFRHACTLELAPSEHASPGATIQSRLLGPMSACVGQPLTLCWRLERGPGAADGKDSVLHYEVAAQGPGWSPGSARSGSVRLGGRPGSIATVEAGWVPLLPGSFAAPRLTIQGVHCQEALDGDQGDNTIEVAMGS
ncbi:hypothetical protein ACKKBG_A13445 [Auxenochlorella protothecoides x Auxenochlorella symbiontica]